MELSKIDKKILGYLYHNCRDSYSKIAKNCNLTRTQVEYHINKYIKNGLIKNFFTLFDYNYLGYNQPIFLLVKLKKMSKKEEFLKLISENCLFGIGETLNSYDFYLTLVFKDRIQSQKQFSKIIFNDFIDYYKVLEPFHMELYPLKFLDESYMDKKFNFTYKEKKSINLDKDELKIIQILKRNAREKIVNIANELGISSELALYKINKLNKDKIILGSKINFNMDMLGYFYTILLINIKNLSNENVKKIEFISRGNPHINSLGLMNNEPNCFVQVFHKTENEIRNTISQIKTEFEGEEISIEILYLEEEFKEIDTFPFLK